MAFMSRRRIANLQLIHRLRTWPEWQHMKTGRVYEIVCVANVAAKNQEVWPVTVVYRTHEADGEETWARPLQDFSEKFEPYYGAHHIYVIEARRKLKDLVQYRLQSGSFGSPSPDYRQACRAVCQQLDHLTALYNNRKRRK